MLTTLSITSLDQGKELARRHVATVYAEPGELVLETLAAADDESQATTAAAARRPKWRSLFAEFIALRGAGYSVDARRY